MAADGFSNAFFGNLLRDWFEGADLRVLLLSDEYDFDPAHGRLADVSPFEIEGDGYPAGGIPLRCRISDEPAVLFDDVHLTGCTFTAHYSALVRYPAGEVVLVERFASPKACAAGTFDVAWPRQGLIRFGGGDAT